MHDVVSHYKVPCLWAGTGAWRRRPLIGWSFCMTSNALPHPQASFPFRLGARQPKVAVRGTGPLHCLSVSCRVLLTAVLVAGT